MLSWEPQNTEPLYHGAGMVPKFERLVNPIKNLLLVRDKRFSGRNGLVEKERLFSRALTVIFRNRDFLQTVRKCKPC